MGLYQRTDSDTWWISFTTQGGKRRRRSTRTTDRKLALKIYQKVMGEVVEDRWFDKKLGSNHTFGDLIKRYLEGHSANNKKPSSYKRDQSLAHHLLGRFESIPLSMITGDSISDYKARRREEQAAPKTINNELALLSHAFNMAKREWKWCDNNPVEGVTRETVKNQIERWLSNEEEVNLLRAASAPMSEIITFAIATGMRQGEIINLQWPEVDLGRRTIIITEQKNGEISTIPLNEKAVEVLRSRARVRQLQHPHVFWSSNGHKWDARNLLDHFYRALEKSGVKSFRFHDLRHTFATRLVQGGGDLYSVQKLGRWKSLSMVQRYAHHQTDSLRSTIEILDRQAVK